MRHKGQVKFVNPNKTDFFPTLKSRVDQYFTDNNICKNGNATLYFKTFILIGLYLFPYFYLPFFPETSLGTQYLIWIIGGFGLAGVGMSVMHDAIHESYSANKKINKLVGYSLNLLGASIFNWKNQHNIMHHTYTNVSPLDEDINDKVLLKFSPHSKVKSFHKHQWTFAIAFYSLLTIYWMVAKDFIQFNFHIRKGVNNQSRRQNSITLSKMIVLKVFYFGFMLVIPIAFFNVSVIHWFLGYITMLAVSGVILSLIFQLAHTVEGTSHPQPNSKGEIENDWAIHQLQTTVNFSRNNPFINWYVGGLNFQVEHHLFPRISHVHYKAISPIVKATAEEYGIDYLENETFAGAVGSHVRLLKKLGIKEPVYHLAMES